MKQMAHPRAPPRFIHLQSPGGGFNADYLHFYPSEWRTVGGERRRTFPRHVPHRQIRRERRNGNGRPRLRISTVELRLPRDLKKPPPVHRGGALFFFQPRELIKFYNKKFGNFKQ